jgi:hypothetical protein
MAKKTKASDATKAPPGPAGTPRMLAFAWMLSPGALPASKVTMNMIVSEKNWFGRFTAGMVGPEAGAEMVFPTRQTTARSTPETTRALCNWPGAIRLLTPN